MTVSGTGVATSRSVFRKRVSIAVAAACGACAGPANGQRFVGRMCGYPRNVQRCRGVYPRLREEVRTQVKRERHEQARPAHPAQGAGQR